MKRIITLFAISLAIVACKNDKKNEDQSHKDHVAENAKQNELKDLEKDSINLKIEPISHATAVFTWDSTVFYTDPVGGAEVFEGKAKPDFVLLTDIHGDHMNAETLKALDLGDTKIIVPKAVKEKLPEDLQPNLIVMNNGDAQEIEGFKITAIPMYNLPQTKDAMHTKGRGNGYVLEKDGKRLYISGDTEDTPEMRALKNIDVAIISMNLPYTMPVDQAADGVLAFKPKKVIPYHYRGKDGFADIKKFKELVNKGDKNIEVELLDWYPDSTATNK